MPQNTSLPELSLTKCWVGPLSHEAGGDESSLPVIMARGVQIKGSLFLDGRFHAEGCVRLDMAEVDGALNCDGGSFKNSEGVALDAEGAKIGGPVSLQKNFESEGRVLLKSAEIGGALMCDGSFRNANGVALSAEAAKIGGAVFLHDNFESEGEVLFGGADIGGALNCDGGSFENAKRVALSAYGAKIGGDVFLGHKNECKGQVQLDRSEIRGRLNCEGGVFENAGGVALSAQGAKIGGDVSFCESRCKGEVSLTCAEIGGALNCDGSFENTYGVALRAEAARIRGAVCLHHNFRSEGEVLLSRAEIGGPLNCDGGHFKNVNRWASTNTIPVALSAYGAKIGGDVFLGNKNRSQGQVLLDRAEIGGALNCTGGVFENADGAALSALGAKIGGDVCLCESRCKGEVLLTYAEIGGALNCDGSFENTYRVALRVEAARIGGAVCLHHNFKSEGEVLLSRAEIGGALHCNGGTFKNANGKALNANYAKIGRDVILELAVEGTIFLEGASIAGDLTLSSKRISKASSAPAAGAILSLQRTNIMGTLDLQDMPKDVKTKVDLGDTSCNVFRIGVSNLEEKHELELHGFVYRRIESEEHPKTQLKWLCHQLGAAKKQGGKEYRPQPYRQFANSLRAHGHDAEARACLIRMANDRRIRANLSWPSHAWQWVLWVTIRNGHQPLRALYFLLGLWALGFLAFGWGYQKRVMEPSDKYAYEDLKKGGALPGQYDPFCATVYAINSVLPIISLGQRDRWHPRDAPTTIPPTNAQGSLYGIVCEASFTGHWDPNGKWVEPSTLATSLAVLRWAWVVLGWFFASMLVVGISGLVGRE